MVTPGMRFDRTVTIGLLWHSVNSDNLGVGALTVSQIAIARAAAARAGVAVRFLVLGWSGRRPAYVTGPGIEAGAFRQRALLQPGGAFGGLLRRTDLVLDIGAGDSFADIYGARRATMQLVSKGRVLAARRPLVLSPQTVGPFRRPWARAGALAIMRRAHAVFTRDELSVRFLRDAGFDGEIRQASDVALRLPCDAPASRRPGGVVRVGLNVSGLLFSGGYDRSNMFALKADYGQAMRRLAAALAGEEGRAAAGAPVELHLVSHVISDDQPVEDDFRVAERIAAATPGSIVAPRFGSPSEAKTYIAGLDFFAGSRMHACIAAFSSGVPVVPLAYSRKFAGLFGSLGYDETVDCRTAGEDEIVAAVLGGLKRRQALAEAAAPALATGLKRLDGYEAFLTEVIAQAAASRAGQVR